MQCKKCNETYPSKLHQGICKLCWSKIGKKSRRKGAKNEREGGAKFYEKEFGVMVRRTPRSGAFDLLPGDIVAKGQTILNDFYIEMKNCEQWKLLEWYEKAKHESLDIGLSVIPIIDVTKNFTDHFIFIRRDHLVRLLKELEGYRNNE